VTGRGAPRDVADRSYRRATGRDYLARLGARASDTGARLYARHPWLLELTEADQLFLSWPVAPAAVAGRIPAPLSLDVLDGRAWITLVSFRMERLHLRGLPPMPLLSSFTEVCCLTHVSLGAERGVWFFRIDAATRLGSAVGRRLFGLPYHHARVSLTGGRDWRCVRSEGRSMGGAGWPELRARYRPTGPADEARPGTLARFLVEPLVMFSRTAGGTLLRGVQTRVSRRLRACEVVVERNTFPEATGLPAPAGEPMAWHSERSVIRAWLPVPVGRGRAGP
jgi:uncharacterized protein YqjF (DUF2071 family)